MNAIETHGLTRDYGKVVAVKDLSLSVKPGTVYGFLGPNGAGKSTTIHMLMGFIKPTSGSASVMGYDIKTQHYEIRKITGYLPERPAFYDDMSGRGNLEYFGKLIGIEDVEERALELLKLVGLEGRGEDRVKAYSHGMRQRLGIAIALLGNPKLLILDEPTTGLDPQGSHDIRELIKKLKGENVTIFLSSHILHEVQEVSDVVGIIKDGRLIVEQSISEFLRSMEGGKSIVQVTASNFDDSHVELLKNIKGVCGVSRNDGRVEVVVDDPALAEDINTALVNAGCRVRGLTEVMPTLEDAFLKVTADSKEEA
ncbi:ABC transporter ATP-binding protein [Methanocella conradii]|uniref:ABC transporter ATP-binding protein n=1 Tax=Methanocella conradii TaxID=1175444 RepID=UPI0024B392C9|nr:ABC transporter ATP-binding protein [Methanocella conradii]MDI6895861.1 ABC transporter ATP-binding protein [Methanocella conradii]